MMECFAEQHAEFNKENREKFQCIWTELEVLNACALDEWELKGRKRDFEFEWDTKYKEEAKKLVERILKFINEVLK